MKSSLGVINKRRESIESLVNLNGFADVADLVQRFQVSAVTIRRDLDELAEEGRILRTHGGAERLPDSLSSAGSDPYEPIQRSIAKAAAALIDENDIVFINSSITASYVIEYMDAKRVSVVSNNTLILTRRRSPDTTLILTGGQVTAERTSMTGLYANSVLSKTVASKCILGVRGISAAEGITSSVLEETYVNQTMVSQTRGPVIVVADHRKIGKLDSFLTCGIDRISTLITDRKADSRELNALREKGVEIIIVEAQP